MTSSKFIRWATTALTVASLATFSSCFPFGANSGGAVAPAGGSPPAVASADGGARTEESPPTGDKPEPPATSGRYPKGYKTQNPYQVISPYKPNNLIDISKNPKTGQPFVSGDLVKDPTPNPTPRSQENKQIFQIP